ncbi:NAD(P)H-dependent oxidoreductase [Salicibibacter kimchii]|nr:NAD(P)H-dependent oxidoreductase [Salicibibacter kimchii]
MQEIVKVKESHALIFIFPIWWYSLPAIMKGYIDRIFNFGIAYGGNAGPVVDKIRWIGLSGHPKHKYDKRGYNKMMEHHLNVGISNYIDVQDTHVHLLYNTLGEFEDDDILPEDHQKALLEEAENIGASL